MKTGGWLRENTDSLARYSHSSQLLGPALSQLEPWKADKTLMVTQDARAHEMLHCVLPVRMPAEGDNHVLPPLSPGQGVEHTSGGHQPGWMVWYCLHGRFGVGNTCLWLKPDLGVGKATSVLACLSFPACKVGLDRLVQSALWSLQEEHHRNWPGQRTACPGDRKDLISASRSNKASKMTRGGKN